jgi:hypothetical protein
MLFFLLIVRKTVFRKRSGKDQENRQNLNFERDLLAQVSPFTLTTLIPHFLLSINCVIGLK